MTILEGVRDFLRDYPGLEALEIDELGNEPGASCLRPVSAETVQKRYLDGTEYRVLPFDLLVRRDADGTRCEDLTALLDFSDWLEGTAQPDLGKGRRAWRLEAESAPDVDLVQENGLLVDRMPLRLYYFTENQEG